MTDILEKLYNGEISPSARFMTQSLNYRQSLQEASKAEKVLCQTFSEEQERLFEEYQRLEGDKNHLECTDRFVYGFRLGLLMAVESYEIRDEHMR